MMIYHVAVTAGKKITIPIEIRRKFGFMQRTKARMKIRGNAILITPYKE
ncbi:hypothetical protein HYW55_01200 [Candidatus Gottesmanbacteria bacterium]|nr:hypothetical protein [Candidatus Gottesmanbacteria bacterium]